MSPETMPLPACPLCGVAMRLSWQTHPDGDVECQNFDCDLLDVAIPPKVIARLAAPRVAVAPDLRALLLDVRNALVLHDRDYHHLTPPALFDRIDEVLAAGGAL